MAKKICDSSEHVPGLAEGNGYKRNWLAFWQAQAGDVKKRKNKFILFHGDQDPNKEHDDPKNLGTKLKGAPGDEIDLNPPNPRTESGPTNQTTKLKAISDKVFLRLRVLDNQFQEFKDAQWHLVIEGIHYPRTKEKPGGPDDWGPFEAGGLINVEIDGNLNVHVGKLLVKFPPPPEKKTDDKTNPPPQNVPGPSSPASPSAPTPAKPKPPEPIIVEFALTIGRLDPIQEPAPDDKCLSGVQQRLNNLGYSAGTVNGVDNDATKGAIKRFQRKCQLTVDGISGPAVQDALHKYHDQPGIPPAFKKDSSGSTTSSPSASGGTTSGSGAPASTSSHPASGKLSGKDWVKWADGAGGVKGHAPAYTSIYELDPGKGKPGFRQKLTEFINALKEAGVAPDHPEKPGETYRCPKRAYLYHWSWRVAYGRGANGAKEAGQAAKADQDKMDGVDIQWDHGDEGTSKTKAKEMADGFCLCPHPDDASGNTSKYAPAKNGKHTQRKAVDMPVKRWAKGKKVKIKKKDGTEKELPDLGEQDKPNYCKQIAEVAASYGVYKKQGDHPHWEERDEKDPTQTIWWTAP